MGYVTKEQTARAREVHVLDYVLKYESNKIKRVGSGYRHIEHPSLAINEKGFYRHSQASGGVTALNYLVEIHGWDFVSAVCHLIEEQPYQKGYGPSQNRSQKPITYIARDKPASKLTVSQTAPSEKVSQTEHKQLILPRRNKDNYHVIAYLHNRGIDRDLIMDCISRGVLYQSAICNNGVFLGKDENGKTRFATMRGTAGDFKCDVEGSDKKYGFVLPSDNPNSGKIAAFEGAIDCMSHYTMCKRGYIADFNGWRLSLGGTCVDTLANFLSRHPEVNHCLICTDNDKAGNLTAQKIKQEIPIPSERSSPLLGKDWNDFLLSVLQAERLKNQVIQHDTPII